MAALCRILRLIPIPITSRITFTTTNITRNVWKTPFNTNFGQKSPNFSILASNYQPKILQNYVLATTTPQFPDFRRNLTKFSLKSGKRKTVKAVIKRFFRLRWGTWIRTKAGKNKHIWKKTINRRKRLRKHVFCNRQQSRLLDHMVTKFWKKKRYYFDDPYEAYHKRNNIYRGD